MITPEQIAKTSEDSHQSALYCWRQLNLVKYPQLKWLHAIPNGGYRDPRTAGKLKATGVRKGVWDNFLPMPKYTPNRIIHCGLYLELKIGKNKLTPEQEQFREDLKDFYKFDVAYSWEEARDCVINYLEG